MAADIATSSPGDDEEHPSRMTRRMAARRRLARLRAEDEEPIQAVDNQELTERVVKLERLVQELLKGK